MQIYFKQVSLKEGFAVGEQPKHSRLVAGKEVSQCSGWALFQTLRDKPIKCWSCGCVADRWVADRGRKHQGNPVLNLYAMRRGQLVLMTRDHIIPKSLGGVDAVENLRPACEVCNGDRGNHLTPEELQFRQDNPHLVSEHRLNQGKNHARNAMKANEGHPGRQAKIAAPFEMIGEPL